jgi:hypothetical protein
MAEYAQQLAAQQSLASLAAAYPGLQSQLSAGFPQTAFQAIQPVAQGPAGLPPTTLLGHPSFINVAGKMYKPVEEPGHTAEVTSSKKHTAAPEPEPRVMTEEDIDRRVEQQVERWASLQRKSGPRHAAKGRQDNHEERAAARVKSVNAAMYRPFHSPI